MSLAPKSLAGRLALLMLLALAVAQGVAVALFAWERVEALRHAHRDNAVLRMADVARLVRSTPPELHDAVVAAASTDVARFSTGMEPLVVGTGSGEEAAAISEALAEALGTGPGQVRVAPLQAGCVDRFDPGDDRDEDGDRDRDDDGDGRDGDRDEDGPDCFTASVPLGEGRWLNAAVGSPSALPPWGLTFILGFLLSALGIAVVAALAGRGVARPMRRLADAAGRLGRGETVDDLPEAGPREIRETVRAFNLMRGRLDRYMRDRTAMLAAVSHDLRTPITSLRLHAEFVEDAGTRSRILAALDEMQRMTEDALAFIREDMRQEETRTVDLHALADSVAADLRDLGHDVEVGEAGRVLAAGRPGALRRALRNLLENAATYGSRARVRVVKDDGGVRVVVEDEGPGIPEDGLERVFEPFVRIEASRSRDTGGSGLGLAIVRGIVRGHGGDVRLENRAEGGLRATVTLPGDGQA